MAGPYTDSTVGVSPDLCHFRLCDTLSPATTEIAPLRVRRRRSGMGDRRAFLGALAAGMVSTRLGRAAPSDRVRVGFIGVGLIGTRHLIDFAAQPDVDVVAISDVSPSRLEAARARVDGRAEG